MWCWLNFQLKLLKNIQEGKKSKLDVNQMKNLNYTALFGKHYTDEEAKMLCDQLKIYQTAYLKELPSELYNGVMNVFYMIMNPNATTDEIDISLVKHRIRMQTLDDLSMMKTFVNKYIFRDICMAPIMQQQKHHTSIVYRN